MEKRQIKDLTYNDLVKYVSERKLPNFRAEQIFLELYRTKNIEFNDFTTLPINLREQLSNDFEIKSLKIKKIRKSTDGSQKFLFELFDGKSVEAVYMPWYDEESSELERVSLCISSMAGCPVGCEFCATGTLGFLRNLTPAEIIDQIILVEKELKIKVTNIVFMGMGEPLLNYNSVKKSIEIITDERADFFGKRKITLSTIGITAKIKQLATERFAPKLALSLHATTNGFRNKIIPLSKQATLKDTLDAIEFYYRQTGMPITYEYIPFEGLNDTDDDAKRLAKILKRVPSRVNIIPFNDISFTHPTGFAKELKPTKYERILEFGNLVREYGGRVTIRDTFGADIEAACGQLALAEEA
ncbi:MAG TPA: 23S rRNA (adenine(2503)-C(2))-methyltransferase RlmN [Candidatus Kapabacteria bacterium]|nr:23S rRNA (adenine(2503)-C(2))-methyltransferase RlmN [Candidatus Kapabacteria bacterium]